MSRERGGWFNPFFEKKRQKMVAEVGATENIVFNCHTYDKPKEVLTPCPSSSWERDWVEGEVIYLGRKVGA